VSDEGKKPSNGESRQKWQDAVNVKRFMNGRMTPSEAHRMYAIKNPCYVCGAPAVMRIRVLVQLAELMKQAPQFVATIVALNPEGPMIPVIPTTYGPMVKVSDVAACSHCQKDAEHAASQHPSWAIVEIDRGPKDVVQTQVPRG